MSIIKRIYLSIIRNPYKSILLFLFFFSIGTFFGSSYLISSNIDSIEQNIEEQIDTYAVIRYKTDFIEKSWDKTSQDYENGQEQLFHIYTSLLENNSVKNTNIHLISDSTGKFVSNLTHKNWTIYEEISKGSLYLCGIDSNSLFNQQSIIEIVSGRFFSKEDIINKNQVIILSEDYTYNDGSKIEIGDKITIRYQNYIEKFEDEDYQYEMLNQKDYSFEVIGKYKINTMAINSIWSNINYKYSYIPFSTLLNIKEQIIIDDEYKTGESNNKIYAYDNIIFQLDSPENLDDFKNEYLKLTNTYKNLDYEILTSADGYYEIKNILDNLNQISILFMIISGGISIIISTLIVYLYLKNRKHEVAILLSIGEKKKNIFIQYICEILLVGILGLSFSTYSTKIVGNQMFNHVINKQLNTLDLESIDNVDYETEIRENANVELTMEYIMIFISGGMIVLCLSSSLPLINLFKAKPKDILL